MKRRAAGLGLLLLACCGRPAHDPVTTTPDTAGQRLAADFARAHGGALDACFGPLPAIRGPGGIQTVADPTRPATAVVNRLVIAIDASGSMAARIGGETKMDAAKRAAITFLHSVPATTQVGLVAFGHHGTNLPSGKDESCHAVEAVYPLGTADPAQVERALNQVRPTGWTPLAAAITLAGRSFTPSTTPGAQVVYVVSDGLETCGGDPVAAARALRQGSVQAVVNIIGFDLTAADRAQLSAVASAGGGSFVEVRSGGEVAGAMDALWHKVRAVSAITKEYFDGGARSTDNNMAVGRYTTDLNFCIARTTTAETSGLTQALTAAPGDDREAAMAALRERHERYRARASRITADLLARSKAANDAIAAQQRASEERLGVGR